MRPKLAPILSNGHFNTPRFLLAILHFRTVLQEPTAGAMEDALASLSLSLDSAFEKTILRIRRLPESRKQLGISILMWISLAKHALNVSELSDALSVKPGQKVSSPNHRPSPRIMLECCQGLVTIDQTANRIHLAHYSIQEYLVVHSERLFPDAQISLGTICLTYMLFEDFRNGPLISSTEIQRHIKLHPFLPYAADYWGVHFRGLDLNERTKSLIFIFLGCQSAIAVGTQAHMFAKDYRRL